MADFAYNIDSFVWHILLSASIVVASYSYEVLTNVVDAKAARIESERAVVINVVYPWQEPQSGVKRVAGRTPPMSLLAPDTRVSWRLVPDHRDTVTI